MSIDITLIPARARQLGAVSVGRVLPAPARRHVGPFVFLDHMGPFRPERAEVLDVPPHPHIGLSTLTYLFEGEALHRDSLGREQPIRPGEVNWMTAGRGIVHSERAIPGAVTRTMHGLQFWVALPVADEEMAPAFEHHDASELPILDAADLRARLVAGVVGATRSPVAMRSPAFLLDVEAPADGTLPLPEHEERAVYVASGQARIGETEIGARTLAVIPTAETRPLAVARGTRAVVFGGAPLDGPRFIWWNFVSSRSERIEEAARAWKEGRFPPVPGDVGPPVPLHDEPRFPRGSKG